MKKYIRKVVPRPLRAWLGDLLILAGWYTKRSYAQEGEDLILARIFANAQTGFYVDVGAHHPVRFSNTYLLYKSGWRGINIDATPGSMRLFRRWRKRDINLELAIGKEERQTKIYLFDDPALNSVDEDLAAFRNSNADRIVDVAIVPMRTLAAVLRDCLPPAQEIDVLSVDVEGWDLDVLESNDWERYRPNYVLIESLDIDMSDLATAAECRFLTGCGYELFAKTVATLIFRMRQPTDAA